MGQKKNVREAVKELERLLLNYPQHKFQLKSLRKQPILRLSSEKIQNRKKIIIVDFIERFGYRCFILYSSSYFFRKATPDETWDDLTLCNQFQITLKIETRYYATHH